MYPHGITPAISHKKNGYPFTGLPALNPIVKANQYTNIVTTGFIIAHDHPKSCPSICFY